MVRPKSGVPRGYQSVMPYLRVSDAVSAIKFYKKAFGAKENFRLRMPGAKVGHAELDIGGSIVMLSDAFPDKATAAPKGGRGAAIHLTLYADNVDKLVAKAVKAGARIHMPVADQFYGDRSGQIVDPFGHVWSVQTRIEKVAPKDMQKRLNAMLSGKATPAKAAAKGRGSAAAAAKAARSTAPRRAAVRATSARKPGRPRAAAKK